jgi:amino acid permease
MSATALRFSILLFNGYRVTFPQQQSFSPFHEVITEFTVHIYIFILYVHTHTHTHTHTVCVCLTFDVSESDATSGTIMSKTEGNYLKKNYDLLQTQFREKCWLNTST